MPAQRALGPQRRTPTRQPKNLVAPPLSSSASTIRTTPTRTAPPPPLSQRPIQNTSLAPPAFKNGSYCILCPLRFYVSLSIYIHLCFSVYASFLFFMELFLYPMALQVQTLRSLYLKVPIWMKRQVVQCHLIFIRISQTQSVALGLWMGKLMVPMI